MQNVINVGSIFTIYDLFYNFPKDTHFVPILVAIRPRDQT